MVKLKKCDKVTYSVDAATAKTILTAYVEAFEKDTEGQDIILNKATAIIEDTKILELYGPELGMTMTADQLKAQVKMMLPQLISGLKAELNELPTDGTEKIDIIVYATATTTYRVEVVVPEAGTLSVDLEDNGIKISMNVEGQEVMTVDIENKDNVFKATANVMNEMVLDITNEKSNKGNNLVAKLTFDDGYDKITAQLGFKNTIKEDSAKKLDEDMEISLIAEVEGEKIDVAIMINRLSEIVDSVDVPVLNATNSIDIIKEGYLDNMLGGMSNSNDYYNTTEPVTNPYDAFNSSSDYEDIMEQINQQQSTTIDTNSFGF